MLKQRRGRAEVRWQQMKEGQKVAMLEGLLGRQVPAAHSGIPGGRVLAAHMPRKSACREGTCASRTGNKVCPSPHAFSGTRNSTPGAVGPSPNNGGAQRKRRPHPQNKAKLTP